MVYFLMDSKPQSVERTNKGHKRSYGISWPSLRKGKRTVSKRISIMYAKRHVLGS